MIRAFSITSLALLLVLAGCSRHSQQYKDIKALDENQRTNYAERLPLSSRLGLYEEMYRSSTPPDTIISDAFRKDPLNSFDAIKNKMVSVGSGDALSYLPILADLERSGSIHLCGNGNIGVIRNILQKKGYDDEQKKAINTWNIGRCTIGM